MSERSTQRGATPRPARLRSDEERVASEAPGIAHCHMVVAATPHQVFEALSDGSRYAEWVVGATEIEAEDDRFPAEGAEIAPRVGVDPVSTDGTTEVTGVDEDHRLELLAHVEPLGRARITFDLRPVPGGTLVVMEEEAIDDDVRGALGRRATRAVRARNAETLWRLKVLVERDLSAPDLARQLGSSRHPAARVPDHLGAATARVFAWASGLRNDRVFHPKGSTFSGTARLRDEAVGLLAARAEVEAVVRVSRGIGLPHPLPDFNGVAIRLVDAHGEGRDQDLLLVSSPRLPIARHLLLPVPFLGWSGTGSVLPYRTPAGLVVFGASRLGASTLDSLGGSLPSDLELSAASLLGEWRQMARLTLTEQVDETSGDALRFDPWHTGPDLLPAGLPNRLRLAAYAASQAARRP